MVRRVVVTGMGGVSPLGNDVETSFARLKVFENCVQVLPELAEYKNLNAHIGCRTAFMRPAEWTRKTTRTMGDVAMYALAATEQAVAQAGLEEADLQSGRTGVAYGSCSGSIAPMLDFFGHEDWGQKVIAAIETLLCEKQTLTPDLGGTAKTSDIGAAILEILQR